MTGGVSPGPVLKIIPSHRSQCCLEKYLEENSIAERARFKCCQHLSQDLSLRKLRVYLRSQKAQHDFQRGLILSKVCPFDVLRQRDWLNCLLIAHEDWTFAPKWHHLQVPKPEKRPDLLGLLNRFINQNTAARHRNDIIDGYFKDCHRRAKD